jgi:hypothetical protein
MVNLLLDKGADKTIKNKVHIYPPPHMTHMYPPPLLLDKGADKTIKNKVHIPPSVPLFARVFGRGFRFGFRQMP